MPVHYLKETVHLGIASRLKKYPRLFYPIAKFRQTPKKRLVTPHSDLVMEGFWRCGNHFAAYCVLVANRHREFDLAHHFHAPSQILMAERWGVPAVVLIREPKDAVASSAVYLGITNPRPLLRAYNRFYEPLLKSGDTVLISDFVTTTRAFGQVLRVLSERWRRDFGRFDHSPLELALVRDLIGSEHRENMAADPKTLPLPSEEKDALKADVFERLSNARYSAEMLRAEALYSDLASRGIGGR